jgi:hypothetical protein
MTKPLITSLFAFTLMAGGCATPAPSDPELAGIVSDNLPNPDISVEIPGLSNCTTSSDATLHINSRDPVNIIVHGCFGSAARFRSLAEVFAFHGSAELVFALNELGDHLVRKDITVIGHSQGGLISRRSLISDREDASLREDTAFRLVTISSPYAGISAADHCASRTAKIISLGLVIPICRLISGGKWNEITYSSDFIQEPGELGRQVGRHLKIDTDETGFCRTFDSKGSCIESDFVFSLEEQYFAAVDNSPLVENIAVLAGHSEIVGDYRTPPEKLIEILQANGIMHETPPLMAEKLSLLLAQLYEP